MSSKSSGSAHGNAGDLASTPVVAVRPDTEAMVALREMYRREVHHLAVVADDGEVGLVTAADVLYGIAAAMPGEPAAVGALGRFPAPRVDAGQDVVHAARLMIDSRADALLVVEGGQVCGVLTAVDVVRAVAHSARFELGGEVFR
ncbi:CBS domain-containing protein [Saccharopolyspora rosea]|uniref:Cyclic nucleotide-binding/CBS domain-containing protein n=1 Tax=Saccharopolyspora rosea TaxID=524884 RepID=A0ABW3FSJ5_9PSEU|nr:CBS domain-containing protein [Saccharopolyspora rosea]